MLKRLRMVLDRWTVSLKLSVKANRYLLIAVFAAGLAGFVFAVSASVGAENNGTTINIFVQIQTESFSFFAYFLRLLIYYAVFFLLLFLSACHFYFLCASFFGLALTAFFFAKGMIFTVMFDGFAGVAVMLFYLLPIAFVFLFTYFLALKDVYALVGFDCNRRRFANVNYYKRPVAKRILKMLLCNLVFDLVFTVLIALIAALF